MTSDSYLRVVLGIIASALVYLCVVLTPLTTLHADARQVAGARTPGEPTGPAEVVIVGWRTSEARPWPVQVVGKVEVGGDVTVTGRVETHQAPRAFDRVVLAGWEPEGPPAAGTYALWNEPGRGLPVVAPTPQRR